MASVQLVRSILCIILLMLLSSMGHTRDSFGEQYAIYPSSSLNFSWKEVFPKRFSIYFGSTVDTGKIMDARVNYTEGCYTTALDCPKTTELSFELFMNNLNESFIQQNELDISFIYSPVSGLPPTITYVLRITNSYGNDTLATFNEWKGAIRGNINLNTILDKNLDSIVIALLILPTEFNFKMGEIAKVDYKQQNTFTTKIGSIIDLNFQSEEPNSYTLVNPPKTLNDYYNLSCINNNLYQWIDVISLETRRRFSHNVHFTYRLNSTTDYFGASLQKANISQINMYSGLFWADRVSKGVFSVKYFDYFSPLQNLYIVAPIIENITMAESNSIVKGSVMRGKSKVYNLKMQLPESLQFHFKYQITLQDSKGVFSIEQVYSSDEICEHGVNKKVFEADYSDSEKSIVSNFHYYRELSYFSIIVGCLSEECNYSFELSPYKEKEKLALVPIIFPIVFGTLLILSVLVIIIVRVIMWRNKKVNIVKYQDL